MLLQILAGQTRVKNTVMRSCTGSSHRSVYFDSRECIIRKYLKLWVSKLTLVPCIFPYLFGSPVD